MLLDVEAKSFSFVYGLTLFGFYYTNHIHYVLALSEYAMNMIYCTSLGQLPSTLYNHVAAPLKVWLHMV